MAVSFEQAKAAAQQSKRRSIELPAIKELAASRLQEQEQQSQRQRDTSRPQEYASLPAFQDSPQGFSENAASFVDYLTTLGSLGKSTAIGAATSVQASGAALFSLGRDYTEEVLQDGFIQGTYDFIRGDQDPVLAAIQAGEDVQSKGLGFGEYRLSGIPEDETARGVFEGISKPLAALEDFANVAGNRVRDTTGSTAAGSAVATSIALAPDLLGFRGYRIRAEQRQAGRQAEATAREQGVTPNAPAQQQAEQISARARQLSEGQQRSGSIEDLVASIQGERQRLSDVENIAWERLRETNAYVSINNIAPISNSVQRALREGQFDLEQPQFSDVRRRLSELEGLGMPGEFAFDQVPVSELVNFRKRLNANVPSDKSAKLANSMIKARFDEYLMQDYTASMISGDQNAISAWRNAIDASTEFKTLFDSKDTRYRILRDLTVKEATPEEYRQFIFGTSVTGARTSSGRYVSAIKEIVGENSPQFQALKNDAVLDIFDPILTNNPTIRDVTRFIDNYDRVFKRTPTLANELFGEGAKDLRDFVTTARAAANSKDVGKIAGFDVSRTVARLSVGNALARNAQKIALVASGLQLVNRMRSSSKKREFVAQMLGYDPNAPLIDKKLLGTIEGIRSSSVEAGRAMEEQEER